MTDPENLFRKPPPDWTDRELAVGIRVMTEKRDQDAQAGDAARADTWNDVLAVLVDERRSRMLLYRETDEAMRFGAYPASTVDISDLVRFEDDDTDDAT